MLAKRAIVFDFDGTIADLLKMAPDITNSVLRQLNMPEMTQEEMEELRRLSIPQAIRRFKMPLWKVPKGIALVRAHLHDAKETIEIVPGMEQILRDLSHDENVTLCILTSNSAENVSAFLKRYKLTDSFDEVVAGLNLFNKPKKLATLLKRLNIPASQAWIIGDELRDLEAGKKNRVKTVAVSWGLGSPERLKAAKPTAFVSKPSELARVLK